MSYNPDPLETIDNCARRAEGRRRVAIRSLAMGHDLNLRCGGRGFAEWFFSWLSMSGRDMEERDPVVVQKTDGNPPGVRRSPRVVELAGSSQRVFFVISRVIRHLGG